MIEIVQSPNVETTTGIRIFLAGGISNCPKWQDELTEKLLNDQRIKNENIIVFNPRSKEIPEEDPQILWEFERLQTSNIICFWFSVGSLNPITLFEYGSHLMSEHKTIIVGCHKDYIKRNNVIVQTKLHKPKLKVNENFEDFYENIVETLLNKLK